VPVGSIGVLYIRTTIAGGVPLGWFPVSARRLLMRANRLCCLRFEGRDGASPSPARSPRSRCIPERKVVAVSGDGGFLMNCQELETAVRLKTPFVNVIRENRQFGSIVSKQEKKFGRHFGTEFGDPDFVKPAES
jgi:hypothetical protein